MKSKIEIRVFAIEQAVAILGVGTPDKDVVSKAKEIEAYIIGDAVLPEIDSENQALMGMMGEITKALADAQK